MKLSGLLHCRKPLWTLIVMALLVSSAMIPMLGAEINSTGTYFWVNPPGNIVKTVGSSFKIAVNVTAAPVNDTRGWALTLEWNKAVLTITGVAEGAFLSKVGATSFFSESLSDAQAKGLMGVGCTLQGTPTQLAGGSGWLCNFTFQASASGTSPLNLKDTKLTNRAGVSKDYPNNDGFFATATPTDDIRITEIKVNASQVEQGRWVQVNVTVHNEGSAAQTFDVKAYADLITHNASNPDQVMVGDETVIGTQTGINLAADASTTRNFIWQTALVRGERWTISAEVINPGELDPHDNVFVGPVVRVVCDPDIKVTGVTIINATVSRGQTAKVNVTVVNEGSTQRSFNITLYANTTLIGWLATNETLAADASTTRTFNWVTTGVAFGTYIINATVPAVAGEKDTVDNKLVDGTIAVVFYDVWMKSITVLDVCYSEGMNPIVYFNITAKNVGTEDMKFDIYVVADPDWPNFPSGNEIVCGFIYVSALPPGENRSFTRILPYGGWNTMVPSVKAVGVAINSPLPGTTYTFIAYPKPWTGYRDDNVANDYASRPGWTLPLVQRDVKVTDIKLVTPKVAVGDIATINVTVSNQGQFNSENVNVTVYADGAYANSTTTTIPKMEWITFKNATNFPGSNVTQIKDGQYFVYNKTLGGKLMGNIDFPANNTLWRLMYPPTPALYYDPVPVTILIDNVRLNATLGNVYRFRVKECRKAGAAYIVQLATPTTPKGYPAVIAWKTISKTVTINWWTGGKAEGDYTITANATIIGVTDNDPCDNVRVDDKIKLVDHDVGVVAISAEKKPYGGMAVYIVVTVKNKGNYKENITVKVYFNDILNTTYTITNLEAGMVHNQTIYLTVAPLTCGDTYLAFIKVNATITSLGVTDDDLRDNVVEEPFVVYVKLIGDVDGSRYVDWVDLGMLGLAYETGPGHPNYNPEADFDGSNYINWVDQGMLGLTYETGC